MKEYIERDVIAAFVENCGATYVAKRIRSKKAFPAADVVEVTFCKDCRYYQDAKVNEKGFLICPASSMEIAEMDYCSYGQRKIETVLPINDAKDESLEADHEVP